MTIHHRPAESRWAKLQRELGEHLSKRLFAELSADPGAIRREPRRSTSWSLLLAYAASLLVYGLSVALGLLGIVMLLRPWHTIFDPVVAAALILLCWAARPHAVAPPYYALRRAEYPTLYALADRIARALQTTPVEGIAYSADFGANYRQVGWANGPYVELGAPLLAILNHQERLAVIAHELSHGANGDPLRGTFLHGAVNTLASWGASFRPAAVGSLGEGLPFGPIISLLGVPFDLLMLALSEFVFLLAKGLLLLVMRQSQRAEYLADRLAASVAGSNEMRSALEKTYLADVVHNAIRVHALTAPYEPIGDKMVQAASSVSLADVEALRAESLSSQWQVDSTHPPTALRVRMLQLTPMRPMPDLLTAEESRSLDLEIDRIVASSEREMINRQVEAMSG